MNSKSGSRLLLYIHGFGSSGKGVKVSMLRERHGNSVLAPSLSLIPDLAIDTLEQLVVCMCESGKIPVLVGSSLGGFYAAYLAEKFDLKAVLINPSVKPYETLASHLGTNHSFYDFSDYEWTQTHIESLKKYAVKNPDPKRFMLLLQTGDDVLDYREASEEFEGARMVIEEGGNHGFEGFESKIPLIETFLGM
jgi:predicted esterase YcpF (UPF0227 family)